MKNFFGVVLMIWSVFSSAKDYPEVVVGKEDGFVDLQFKISSLQTLKSGNMEFVVKGTLNNVKVGFIIELLPSWVPKKVEGLDQPIYWGNANFKAVGSETSAFLFVLSKLYGKEIQRAEAYLLVAAEVVGLACNPMEIMNTPCQMKLFFNSNAEASLYSEIFLNIDVSAKTLELNEIDNDYRVPLLRSLIK